MRKLVAKGRIEAGKEGVFDPGSVLPDWSEADKQRLITLGAAEMREVSEDDVAASGPAEKPKIEVNPDSAKFRAFVDSGVVTEEQMFNIVTFWEIKTWDDFVSLSEVELTQIKGVGKATAMKILASVKVV